MQTMNVTSTFHQTHTVCLSLRIAMLAVLLLIFTQGVNAQVKYIMYYDEANGTRHYVSISKDGNSVVDETTFSDRCIWEADGALFTVKGEKEVKQTSGQPNNIYNEPMRRALRSVAFTTKYLVQNSGEKEDNATSGPWAFNIRSSASELRWMMDNEFSNTPILYYYYYKHYIYSYDGEWLYSTKGHTQSSRIKIEHYSLTPPQINIRPNGDGKYLVSISAAEGCNIYYTTDGNEPTTGSNLYSGPFNARKGTTIKAKSTKGTDHAPAVAEITLQESLTVTLDDREDHMWTYYSGVNTSVDGSSYNNNYKGYIYSPNPRNVMITYRGGGITLEDDETGNANAAVGIDAPETSFEYKKTLEKIGNRYPYTTIANPFSKRPSKKTAGNQKQFYGFAGWKVISITGGSITGYAVGSTIPAEKEINFEFTREYAINTTSAEVVLEAVWAPAQTTYLTSAIKNKDERNNGYVFNITNSPAPTTHENNFLVLDNVYSGTITASTPCTIMMVEPDGSADHRGLYALTGNIIPVSGAENRTKIEYTRWNSKTNINARGCNFTIGRGMNTNGRASLYGTSNNTPVNQILKIESGKFSEFIHYGEGNYTTGDITKQWVTLGNDYDRARGDNEQLEITGRLYVGYKCALNLDADDEMCRVYGLSGKFMTSVSLGAADWQQCYYMSVSDKYNKGHRYLELQGGEWLSITGGTDYYEPSKGLIEGYEQCKDKPSFTFRMKGGHVKGSIYGAAAFYDAVGTRTFVITGGTINGWIAGGANGTRDTGGKMEGASYVYIGGNAKVDSRKRKDSINPNVVINRAVGGNVFGAGCGFSASSSSGQVTLGTNVVIADDAYVERGVYGGGSYGYCTTTQTATIYITGGTIGGSIGGVNNTSYSTEIKGGVFGGACQNRGGTVNIYMTGGIVNGGIYGGSNASGALSGNVNMTITGGTVGSEDVNASVYGGGYGSGTTITGNVDLTMTGGLINGNVFGGGNEGAVSGNTTVTITGGEVKQNVYGGGNQAAVSGETKVTIGN